MPSPVSRDLQQLLQEQRKQAAQLKRQHDRDLQLQQQQWRKEDLALRQQQRSQEQMVRLGQQSARQRLSQSQQSSRSVLEGLVKRSAVAGLSAKMMIPVLKGTGEWQKLSRSHQDTLQRAVAGGVNTSDEMLRHIESRDKKDRQRQSRLHQDERRTVAEHHEQERLAARHKAEQSRGALRGMLGSESLAQGTRHGQEQLRLRQQQQERHRQAARASAPANLAASNGMALGQGILSQMGLGGLASPQTAAATIALKAFTFAVQQGDKAIQRYNQTLQIDSQTGKLEANPVTRERLLREERRQENGIMGSLKNRFIELSADTTKTFTGKTISRRPLYGEEGYRAKEDTSREAYDRYRKGHANMPRFLRWMHGISNQAMSYEQFVEERKGGQQVDLETFEARQARQFAGQYAATEFRGHRAVGGLRLEETRLRAGAEASFGQRASGYGLTLGAANERSKAIGQLGQGAPYNRARAIEDVTREIGMREQQARASMEGQLRQRALGAQLVESQGQEGFYRGKFGQAMQGEKQAVDKVNAAVKENQANKDILRLADAALAATERRKQAEDSLLQSQMRSLSLRKQSEQDSLQTQEQLHKIAVSTLQANRQAQEQVQRERQQSTERLGLMHPMQQRTLLGVARKIQQRGIGAATQNEIRLMQQNRDIFGNVLQKIGTQRGTALMDEFRKIPMLGLDNREQALKKQEVMLKQHIEAKIVIDHQSLGDQLAHKVLEPLQAAIAQEMARLQHEITGVDMQRWTQRRAQFGGKQ